MIKLPLTPHRYRQTKIFIRSAVSKLNCFADAVEVFNPRSILIDPYLNILFYII